MKRFFGHATDHEGKPLPVSSEAARQRTVEILDDDASEVLLVIMQRGHEIAVSVHGRRPDPQVLAALKTAVAGYEKALAAYLAQGN